MPLYLVTGTQTEGVERLIEAESAEAALALFSRDRTHRATPTAASEVIGTCSVCEEPVLAFDPLSSRLHGRYRHGGCLS